LLNPDEANGDKGQNEGHQRKPEGILYSQRKTLLVHLQERLVRSGFEPSGEIADMHGGAALDEGCQYRNA